MKVKVFKSYGEKFHQVLFGKYSVQEELALWLNRDPDTLANTLIETLSEEVIEYKKPLAELYFDAEVQEIEVSDQVRHLVDMLQAKLSISEEVAASAVIAWIEIDIINGIRMFG